MLDMLREFLAARGTPAYLVGGAVRDLLLGRETHDLDVSVPGPAAPLARAFADRMGGAFFVMDEEYDVARAIFDKDGAREIVDVARVRGGSIQQDLATRDLTINAMAVDLASWDGSPGSVIDPFGGRADLAARRLRAVSADSFRHDPVRMLRAVRFEAELAFALDPGTAGLIRDQGALLQGAPGERVRDELVRIVSANDSLRQLQRLDSLGLLSQVLPELDPLRGVAQSPPHVYDVFEHTLHAVAAAEEAEKAGYANLAQGAFAAQLQAHFHRTTSADRKRRDLLRLALLFHDTGKPATRTVEATRRVRYLGHETVSAGLAVTALRRLRFSNDEIALVTTIVANHMRPILLVLSGLSDRAIHRFFRATGDAGVDIAVHAWCDQRATYGAPMPPQVDSDIQSVLGRLLDRYYHAHARVVAPPPLVNGQDLIDQLALSPGPQIGALLAAIREAQAEGRVLNRGDALALAADLAKNFDSSA